MVVSLDQESVIYLVWRVRNQSGILDLKEHDQVKWALKFRLRLARTASSLK